MKLENKYMYSTESHEYFESEISVENHYSCICLVPLWDYKFVQTEECETFKW